MGKQSRRKPRKKSNNNSGRDQKSSNNNNTTTSSSTLINKIRHVDVNIRHGALSGLSSTIFSPESLSNSKNIKLELIQAIAEQIMDDDVPCASCAVGCIANYILFQDTSNNNNNKYSGDNKSQDDEHRLETILAPILMTKLNQVCNQIKSIHEQMVQLASTIVKNNNDNNNGDDGDSSMIETQEQNKKIKNKTSPLKRLELMTRMIMDQFSLISLSLHAFCGIVEIFSVNNSASSLLYHQRDQFLSAIMNSYIISTEMIRSLATAATSNKDNNTNIDPVYMVNKLIANHENESNIISDVAVYAARTIHSSSDENPEFVKAILTLGNTWDVIISSIVDTSLPTLSRLHSAGTVIASRQFILESASYEPVATKLHSKVDDLIKTQIFGLLGQCITYSTDISSALCTQIANMESKLQEEKTDEELEKNVVKMVNDRKESARSIAKRQKEMKVATKKANDQSIQEKEEPNVPKDGDMSDIEDKAYGETELKYDKAISAWRNACLPLKLSIEVLANLCADRTSQEENNSYDDMDDDMGWNSDQEETLLNTGANELPNHKPQDIKLFQNVVSTGIPDQVLSVFGTILLSFIGTTSDLIPRVALDDLFEILGKCSICLGNIVCNLDTWKSNEGEISSVWNEFFQCLQASIEGEATVTNMKLPYQGIASLLSTMVAFLRFRPTLSNLVNEQDLTLILSYVSIEVPLEMRQSKRQSDRDDVDAILDIQKDSICLLGILSSEPHPDGINNCICIAFLGVLSRSQTISASLICEVLNVLMDMYSADEGDPNNHESIFRKNNVLVAFEKTVPVLKRKIREESQSNAGEIISYWKETALNASRFIKYKK